MDKHRAELTKNNVELFLNKHNLQGKNVYVGPANYYSLIIIRILKENGIDVKCVIDDDKRVNDLTLDGIKIKKVVDCLIPFDDKSVILLSDGWNLYTQRRFDFMEYWNMSRRFYMDVPLQKNFCRRVLSKIARHTACRKFVLDSIAVIKGEKIYRNIYRRYKKQLYVFPWKSIGDIYILGLYLNQNAKLFRDDFVLVVCGNSCAKIASGAGFKDVEAISENMMSQLMKFEAVSCDDNNIRLKVIHYDYTHIGVIPNITVVKKMHFLECYENIVFGEQCKGYTKDYDTNLDEEIKSKIKRGKTVILAPYAKSIPNIEIPFWESVVAYLNQEGFCIVTNSGDSYEPAIRGSIKINIPLNQVKDLADYAGYFIGERSGLCDLVSSSYAKKIFIYPRMKTFLYDIFNFYSFKYFPNVSNFREIECSVVPAKEERERVYRLLDEYFIH